MGTKQTTAQRPKRADLERDFGWRKTGVFEVKAFGTTVAYFVGWRTRFGTPRNIRADLFFDSAEKAIAWRDAMENQRKTDQVEFEQIA